METKRARMFGGAALVVALALAASACGGSSSSNTTTTSAASATQLWASGVCTSFSAWRASLQRAKTSLGSNPSTSAFQNAAHQAEIASQGLQSSLQQLGPPPTAAAASAQQSIATLKSQLQSGKKEIDNTLSGNPQSPAEVKAAVSSVRTTANGMLKDFSTTVNDLKALDPKSELEKAFKSAPSCQPFFT